MIDLVIWLLDKKPISVFASGNKIATKESSNIYNSFSVIILKFDNNLDVKISGNGACIYGHYHEMKIFGKNASIISNKDTKITQATHYSHTVRKQFKTIDELTFDTFFKIWLILLFQYNYFNSL